MQYVVQSVTLHRVLVSLSSSVRHQIVGLNASVILNVPAHWRAFARNVKIRAQEHVVTTPNAALSVIHLYVCVCKDMRAIRSHNVISGNKNHQEKTYSHVCQVHADRMPFVANKTELVHANVYQNTSVIRMRDVDLNVF